MNNEKITAMQEQPDELLKIQTERNSLTTEMALLQAKMEELQAREASLLNEQHHEIERTTSEGENTDGEVVLEGIDAVSEQGKIQRLEELRNAIFSHTSQQAESLSTDSDREREFLEGLGQAANNAEMIGQDGDIVKMRLNFGPEAEAVPVPEEQDSEGFAENQPEMQVHSSEMYNTPFVRLWESDSDSIALLLSEKVDTMRANKDTPGFSSYGLREYKNGVGIAVRAERSSGEIQDDWLIDNISAAEDGAVSVDLIYNDGGKILRKRGVTVGDLYRWNS